MIKRVKELLGISKPDAQPLPARPPARQSGRLVTSGDAPIGAAAQAPPTDGPEPLADSATPEHTRADQAPAENRYFGKFDAAFDSLDAQLAGRAAPGDRHAPPSVALAPADEPAPRLGAQPVFDVDEEWFGKNASSSVRHEEHTAPESNQPDEPAPSEAPTAAREQAAPTYGEISFAAPAPAAPMTPMTPTTPDFGVGATYGATSPPTALAADAFARLWAHEQGEPLPPVPPPAPIELSEQTVDAVVRRLTDGLAARVTDALATRLTADLATSITDGLAEQIATHVAERVMQNAFGDSLRQTVHDVSERLVREEIARIRAAASTDSPIRTRRPQVGGRCEESC